MIIHIINAVKQKDFTGLWLDTNGVAGLVFYGSLVLVIVLFMTGNTLPAGVILAVLFGVPLILIGFKEPIGNFLQKKKAEEKTGAVMTVVQAAFELIEVLLSYFSNTISFVRIGAVWKAWLLAFRYSVWNTTRCSPGSTRATAGNSNHIQTNKIDCYLRRILIC